ncbi:hypothetical protein TPCV2_18540 [Cutibacterium avidum]|nr:hypothetical protein TPCV4_15280 [Cutibacterium avidum]
MRDEQPYVNKLVDPLQKFGSDTRITTELTGNVFWVRRKGKLPQQDERPSLYVCNLSG